MTDEDQVMGFQSCLFDLKRIFILCFLRHTSVQRIQALNAGFEVSGPLLIGSIESQSPKTIRFCSSFRFESSSAPVDSLTLCLQRSLCSAHLSVLVGA